MVLTALALRTERNRQPEALAEGMTCRSPRTTPEPDIIHAGYGRCLHYGCPCDGFVESSGNSSCCDDCLHSYDWHG